MKLLILLFTLSMSWVAASQNLYKATNGKVRFFSDALLEDIEATTIKTTAAWNTSTGEVAVLIPIQGFIFDKALMREHFNENYMESDRYPDASFKGEIIEKVKLEPGENLKVNIAGELSIHGVPQHRNIIAILTMTTNRTILVSGKFNVNLADHKIKVPRLVFQNIAEEVEVSFEYTFKTSVQP